MSRRIDVELTSAREDGSWTWRWDPMKEWNFPDGEMPDFDSLWGKVDEITAPILFLRGGAAAGDAGLLDGPALLAVLRAGLEGIVARGKAEPGDKTMYDALAPALDAYDGALSSGADVVAAANIESMKSS